MRRGAASAFDGARAIGIDALGRARAGGTQGSADGVLWSDSRDRRAHRSINNGSISRRTFNMTGVDTEDDSQFGLDAIEQELADLISLPIAIADFGAQSSSIGIGTAQGRGQEANPHAQGSVAGSADTPWVSGRSVAAGVAADVASGAAVVDALRSIGRVRPSTDYQQLDVVASLPDIMIEADVLSEAERLLDEEPARPHGRARASAEGGAADRRGVVAAVPAGAASLPAQLLYDGSGNEPLLNESPLEMDANLLVNVLPEEAEFERATGKPVPDREMLVDVVAPERQGERRVVDRHLYPRKLSETPTANSVMSVVGSFTSLAAAVAAEPVVLDAFQVNNRRSMKALKPGEEGDQADDGQLDDQQADEFDQLVAMMKEDRPSTSFASSLAVRRTTLPVTHPVHMHRTSRSPVSVRREAANRLPHSPASAFLQSRPSLLQSGGGSCHTSQDAGAQVWQAVPSY